MGTEFRAGSFENEGNLTGGTPSNYLNFITVLATQDNTEINFSEFGNGVSILNDIQTENIILNNGESYSVAITPYPSSTNSANATGLIGALVESDKPIAVNSGSFEVTQIITEEVVKMSELIKLLQLISLEMNTYL